RTRRAQLALMPASSARTVRLDSLTIVKAVGRARLRHLRRRKSAEIIEQKKYTASMFGIAPKLRICGDRTVMVEFEQTISPAINDAIHGLAAALENANIPGLVECTPCYCSLGVHYDPLQIQCHDLMEQLSKLLSSNAQDWRHVGRRVEVPVVYGGD